MDTTLPPHFGIILQLPTNDDLNKWKHIDVVLAPVGINKLPNGVISRENLLQNGWKEVKVGTAPENEVRMYGKIAAKRKQYAIKPRIAMTIHKALGGDFGSVATSVNFSNRDFGYRLWQKEQVEVLISRTHTTKDLIFVGDPTETADNLRKYGGFVPGIRPGENTALYIEKIVTKFKFFRAIKNLYLEPPKIQIWSHLKKSKLKMPKFRDSAIFNPTDTKDRRGPR